jgi:predicted dehydrogenase
MPGTVRLGVVGCGKRGIHVGALFRDHPSCSVVALADRFPARAESAARELGLPAARIYTDFDALLREAPVDALFFACPPTEQVDLACQAMEAGRHVCTEVVAAFSIEECWRLVRTVEKTGCKYQLMEQTRYWGFVDAWRRMHERGEFGHICFAQGEYIHYEKGWNYWVDTRTGEFVREIARPRDRQVEPTWRRKILADPIYYLPHTLSPLLKILDDRVVRVSCMGTRKGSYTYADGELPWSDIQYSLMHTGRDTVLAVGAGFSLPYPMRGETGGHWYELRGTKAAVESPRSPSGAFRLWRPGMADYEKVDLSTIPVGADEEQARTGHGGADFKPVDTFIRAILEDRTPPVDVYLAAEITAPAVVAAESARLQGATLEVPDFRPATRGRI